MTKHDPELIRVLRGIDPKDEAKTTKAGDPNLNYLKEKLGRKVDKAEAMAAWASIHSGAATEPAKQDEQAAGSADGSASDGQPGEQGEQGEPAKQGEQGDGSAPDGQPGELQANFAAMQPKSSQVPGASEPKAEAPARKVGLKLIRPRRVTFITAG